MPRPQTQVGILQGPGELQFTRNFECRRTHRHTAQPTFCQCIKNRNVCHWTRNGAVQATSETEYALQLSQQQVAAMVVSCEHCGQTCRPI